MTMRYAHLAPSHLRAGIRVLEERNTCQAGRPELSTELCVTPVSQDFGGIRVSAGVPNGIFKEVAQSLAFKIKGSARNVVKAR